MDDLQIIELYWERNDLAISATNEKYGKYCHSVANGILHSEEDADECVNDTWLAAWQTIPPQRPNVLKIFLAKITRNLSLDRYRMVHAQKRGSGELPLVLDELGECVSGAETPEESVLTQELGRTVNAFVKSLPERDAGVFLRRYFYAEPVAQIAEKFGMTANHTAVLLSRLRDKLKKYLEQEGYVL